jgi:drug/metabolite transporter (DMT)-like permease
LLLPGFLMTQNNRLKGYLFSLGASIALANSFIFSKAALNEVTMIQFGIYWFGMGVFWNLLFVLYSSKGKLFKRSSSRGFWINGTIALLEAVATGIFYIAIMKMENPSIVSFVGNIGPIFVTFLGITLLKERFNWVEMLGIVVTLSGIIVINYTGRGSMGNLLMEGTEYVIAASVLFSIAAIIARKYNQHLNSARLSIQRALLLFFGFILLFVIYPQSLNLSGRALLNISIGSILETLITIVFAYEAFKYIEATRNSLVISTKSLFVLLSTFLYFHIFPTTIQIVGGILTIAGVLTITTGKIMLQGRKR